MKLRLPYPEDAIWKQADDTVTIDFVIPETFPYLEGHFPNNPLVPAVTQVGWAILAVEILCGHELEKYQLSRFKFIRPIRPLDTVSISLVSKNDKYTFRATADGELCSVGKLILNENV